MSLTTTLAASTDAVLPLSGVSEVDGVTDSPVINGAGLGTLQVFPRATTITSIFAQLTTLTSGIEPPGSSVILIATLYIAPAGSTLASATGVSCAVPLASGLIPAGTTVECSNTASSQPVAAGSLGMIVIRMSVTGVANEAVTVSATTAITAA